MATATVVAETTQLETPLEEVKKGIPEGEQGPVLNWPAYAWEETSRFFEKFFARSFPAVDIFNRENAILVCAELPGVLKEDLSVSVGDNSVVIKGSTSYEEPKEGEYVRREISRWSTFSRTLSLPEEVDAPKGKAKFKDCMLELTLPKKSAKRHTLKID